MRARWLLSFFLALPLFGQDQHPFTFEDMMALKRVGEPVVSPNGKWVLFAAVDVDLKANTKTPHVWVVPLSSDSHPSPSQGTGQPQGNREREIISDQDADRPRWAPDGKRFAFVSTKEEGSQIWIADFDDATGTVTAKQRLTSTPAEADGELWSPDGKYVLFKSDVDPQCAGRPEQEAICIQEKVKHAKESKVKAQIFTHLLYRHWNAYKEGKRTHLFVVPVATCTTDRAATRTGAAQRSGETRKMACPSTTYRDLTPGDWDAPVFSLGGQDNYAFSPDGKELCYASNHSDVEAASTNNDLFVVPVDFSRDVSEAPVLAATKNITAENRAADNTPLYSLDGNYIAYRAQARPGYESDRWRLMLYDRKKGEKKELTEGFDHWVGSFVWARDSKLIYASAEHKRHSLIYAIATMPRTQGQGDYLRRSLVEGYNDDLAITPDGKTLIFTRMSVKAPNEIYGSSAHGDGCPSQTGFVDAGKEDCSLNQDWPITRINQAILSSINMGEIEPFWFDGAKGDKVEASLVKPPNFDPKRKYPVKFLIHGGPEGAWGDDWSYRWNAELFAANGYVVIMINFHGSTGYGQNFTDAIKGDWGGAPFEDLMKGLDYAEQHYPFIDKNRECALGASYGGYMANWLLGHTSRFQCIVTHDGMFNTESAYGDTEELWFPEWEFKGTPWTNREMYRKWSPHLSATSFKTPTLVVHGQLDYRLDVSQGFDLFTTLQRQGVPSKMLYFPDEGHWVLKPQNSQLWYKTVNDWVDEWTGKQ